MLSHVNLVAWWSCLAIRSKSRSRLYEKYFVSSLKNDKKSKTSLKLTLLLEFNEFEFIYGWRPCLGANVKFLGDFRDLTSLGTWKFWSRYFRTKRATRRTTLCIILVIFGNSSIYLNNSAKMRQSFLTENLDYDFDQKVTLRLKRHNKRY